MLLNLLAGSCFLGFLVVGFTVWLRLRVTRGDAARQFLVSILILYVVAVSFGAAILQRDLWPFSAWKLMIGEAPTEIADDPSGSRIVGVDANGNEYRIDHRVWQPLAIDELGVWLRDRFPQLSDAQKERIGAFMLDRANEARRQARSGDAPGYLDRFLGPLSAPFHLLHVAAWPDPGHTPPDPFTHIRVYREFWKLEERLKDRARIRLELSYEYPAPR